MTIEVAHSGHLYVFFICLSYHEWGKGLVYRNVYLGVIHRERAWFDKVIHRFTIVIHRIDLTDIF
jgi:hypothetical protein